MLCLWAIRKAKLIIWRCCICTFEGAQPKRLQPNKMSYPYSDSFLWNLCKMFCVPCVYVSWIHWSAQTICVYLHSSLSSTLSTHTLKWCWWEMFFFSQSDSTILFEMWNVWRSITLKNSARLLAISQS